MSNKKIGISFDGENLDLEEVFNVLEDLYEDTEKTFDHMMKKFEGWDDDLEDKLNRLKIKLAADRDDEFEYIPDYMEGKVKVRRSLAKWMLSIIVPMMVALGIFVAIMIYDDVRSEPETIKESTGSWTTRPLEDLSDESDGEMKDL